MVGDSQIGKTSLMSVLLVSSSSLARAVLTLSLPRRVKYVEGSYDEDYIQTLGTSSFLACPSPSLSSRS